MDLLLLLRYWVQSSSFWIISNLVNWNRIRFPVSGQIFAICGIIPSPKLCWVRLLKPMRGWCQMNLQICTQHIPEFEHLTVICKYWVIISIQGPAPHTIFDNISFEEFYLMVDWIWLTPWLSLSLSISGLCSSVGQNYLKNNVQYSYSFKSTLL